MSFSNPELIVKYKGWKPHTFFRYCNNCNQRFQPDGKWAKLCVSCRTKLKGNHNQKLKGGK